MFACISRLHHSRVGIKCLCVCVVAICLYVCLYLCAICIRMKNLLLKKENKWKSKTFRLLPTEKKTEKSIFRIKHHHHHYHPLTLQMGKKRMKRKSEKWKFNSFFFKTNFSIYSLFTFLFCFFISDWNTLWFCCL